MAGDILIIDCVATNRIVLKVKLLAAQYRVRPCANVEDATAEIAAAMPDLILLDVSTERDAAIQFCEDLKRDPQTSLIPVIATGVFVTPRDRVAALQAGADDVLSKPFDDHILQARIRSLLRSRDARLELRMREGTRTALGFGEAACGFTAPASVVMATEHRRTAVGFDALQRALANTQLKRAAIDQLIAGQSAQAASDLFVVDFRTGLQDDKVLYRLLSELRSRSGTRHAGILALLPRDARHAAAMALDLGANDIVCGPVDTAEIHHRCAVLIQAKREADALRRTVETGLEAAITDPLTGLFNRRYALPHLARLSSDSREKGRQFAIMVLDLDHFKTINDTLGHTGGDEILKQVAARLQGNLRAVDLLARIGGEEFLIAIPNSDLTHARTAAERLCRLVADTPFFVGAEQREVRVTMSVGVSLSDGTQTKDISPAIEDLVNAADTALYAAKNGGRNKVSLAA